ncbi:Ribosomal large subunit pseudouridine synthase A [Aquisphaera giovannonii]|uniref:Ribosomal large subunit pseudouridine synthase A n=1 Tax=Aquisphaera giovannonii TaxID=406548 RepID=A0A5B9WAY7_9BACT|nr:RluA family pseudouridine synthase [Aquisphaera giovannonii]QEH37637.1 Ribosomal large subunit pseudouridine synthase A [Aquisphaera giovannonii]
MTPAVLYEDNHCLVVDKPAGLLSQGDVTGDPSLVTWAADYLKARYEKPGNVYVGLVHRLDRPTSGVVLLARTSKAAGRLAEQFRSGGIQKVYLAVVEGGPPSAEGTWDDVLEKDRRTNRVRVVERPAGGSGEKDAEVAYRVLERSRGRSTIELRPITGRSHQLRVQLAARGLPIVGDRKYGASSVLEAVDGGRRIALHARSLTFIHPTRGVAITVEAPLPADWPAAAGR